MKPCPRCGGSGRVALGEHFVTHDMALDAGEPQLEGASMGIEWGDCPDCYGVGYEPSPNPAGQEDENA